MVPSQARVLLSGITGEQIYGDRIEFWSNIYGVSNDKHGRYGPRQNSD